MNKRGQIGGIIVLLFVYVSVAVCWFGFLGEVFTEFGQTAIANGATGGEAFFYAYLNLWFWIVYLVTLVIGGTLVSGAQ